MKRIIRAKTSTLLFNERLHRRFRPKQVCVLFVGESPPASGRFFYAANSGLYRSVRDAFMKAFPDLGEPDFLESFRSMGCYLVDLCEKPVDQLSDKMRRNACRAGEARLTSTLRKLHPQIVVTVVRSIAANVARSEHQAGWTGLNVNLPYPGRWIRHRVAFVQELARLLPGWKLDGVKSVKRRTLA